jgi:integrase
VGVRCKQGRLFLDFRWRGVRCREFTELTDTPENRRRCTALLRIIKGEIALGTFDYRRHFPNGTRLATFYPEVARSGTTVASFLSTWHARRSPFRPNGTVVEMAELHPSTWKHDGSLIERRLIPALGTLRLTDLRVGRCRDYRRELEAEGLSGKTVTNILGLLHKAMADAVDEGLLAVNPVPRLARRSRRAQGMRSNSDPLSLDEVKAFLDAVPGLYRDLYVVWFRTGWRPSEILALRFEWLDAHRQTVLLRLGRIARWGGVEAPPKTGPREVDCRYDPEIFAAFERCRPPRSPPAIGSMSSPTKPGSRSRRSGFTNGCGSRPSGAAASTPAGSTTSATPSSRTRFPPVRIPAGWRRSAARPSR